MRRLIPRFLRVLIGFGFIEPPTKGKTMLRELAGRIAQKAAEAAKAIVGLATPIVTQLVIDILAEVSDAAQVAIVAGATALMVWLVPNKPPAAG